MSEQYIESETFTFGGGRDACYVLQAGRILQFISTHIIKRPYGNLYKLGCGTSIDPYFEHLKYKLHHVYLSAVNFYEVCKMIINEEFICQN